MGSHFRIQVVFLLVLVCALGASGATDFFGLVIQSLQTPRPVVVEKLQINESDELYRLPSREAPATINKDQYEKFPKVPFADISSFRVAAKGLQVRTRAGVEFLALPREFKTWPKTPIGTDVVVRGSKLASGKNKQQSFPLSEGMVVYLFTVRPADELIAYSVAEAQNTQEGWETYLQKYRTSPRAGDAAKPLVEMYLNQAREALGGFESSVSEKKPGYGNLAEAKKWVNSALNWVSIVKGTPPPVTEVQDRITRRESELRDLLARARTSADNDCPAAEKILEPMLHFRPEWPDLVTTEEAIKEVCARNYLNQARRHRNEKRFDDAEKQLEVAKSYRDLPEIEKERAAIAEARQVTKHEQEMQASLGQVQQAVTQGDCGGAFEALASLQRRFPEEPKIRDASTSAQSTCRPKVLEQAAKVESLCPTITGGACVDQGLKAHNQLSRLRQFAPGDVDVDIKLDGLSDLLAEYDRKRWEAIKKGNPSAILAFAYLRQACWFAAANCPREFQAERERIERELRTRVLFDFSDKTPGQTRSSELAELSALVSTAIQNSGLPHLDIVESGASSLEFKVELLAAEVGESVQTEAVKSEYVAGTRQVQNPEWLKAKTVFDLATTTLEQTRARIQNKKPPKGYGKKEREADQASLPRLEAGLKKAQTDLTAIPTQVPQEDVQPYTFFRKKVTRTAVIRASYRWVVGGERKRQEIPEEKESTQGESVTDVKAGDRGGHSNKAPELSDDKALLSAALRRLADRLAREGISFLKSTYVGGYYERAQQNAARLGAEAAAEDYLRFLYIGAGEDPRRQQVIDYLKQQLYLVALDWVGVGRD